LSPAPYGPDDLRHFSRADDGVDLWNLRTQLVAVALGQAPGDDERPATAALLVLGQLEDRVDRLLLRFVDERARVDDEDVSVCRVACQLVAGLLREPEHDLGVDEVFRAAERHHSNLHSTDPRILDG
jgi:hypothetical protein